MFNQVKNRFIRYAKINTRSNESSKTVPSTSNQRTFALMLKEELEDLGLSEVVYNEDNGYLTASLEATSEEDEAIPTIGFIAHMDTADFNAENIQPQIHENYQGQTITLDAEKNYVLSPDQFPHLKNYLGQALITTDGRTLLGADDKAGIAEIVTAAAYLLDHPEVKHGKLRFAFGPDEEIGRGAKLFDVKAFDADFAYTVDGGSLGELQYESFNAAQADIRIKGLDVHPGTAKGFMINAILIAQEIIQALPADAVPEKTEGKQGFYHVFKLVGKVEEAELSLIIRDHDKDEFLAKKDYLKKLINQIQTSYGSDAVIMDMYDQYYNMAEVIKEDPWPVELAETAMKNLGIMPIIEATRGGTDGSIISFMGLPTPNLFTGGENFHGRYEFIAVESMVKATETIIEIVRLQAEN